MNRLKKLFRRVSLTKDMTSKQDNRSYHFVAVIDCIINQNTRDAGAATFPGMNREVIQLCNDYNVGILQMPCPEIAFLGFSRTRPTGTSIRAALDTSDGRACCRKLSIDIADRIEEIIGQGAEFLAVLGGNPESPGCAVHAENGDEHAPSGVLIAELRDELHKRSIRVPFLGIRDFDAKLMAEDIQWLKQLFAKINVQVQST
jgi:predicted secreted protein